MQDVSTIYVDHSVPRKSGRPRTGQRRVFGVRLSENLRAAIEEWARNQHSQPTPSEAARRLIELGLKASKNSNRG